MRESLEKKPPGLLEELLNQRKGRTGYFLWLRQKLSHERNVAYEALADETALRGLDSEKAQMLLEKIERLNRGIRRYRKLAGEN